MEIDVRTKARMFAELEEKLSDGIDVEENMKKMQKLAETCSVDEMCLIDEYLSEGKII